MSSEISFLKPIKTVIDESGANVPDIFIYCLTRSQIVVLLFDCTVIYSRIAWDLSAMGASRVHAKKEKT